MEEKTGYADRDMTHEEFVALAHRITRYEEISGQIAELSRLMALRREPGQPARDTVLHFAGQEYRFYWNQNANQFALALIPEWFKAHRQQGAAHR